jgi:hypothetical protein
MRAGCSLSIVSLIGFILTLPSARADEGFWLFNDPPRKLLKERYGCELSDAWLDHVRLATVRFRDGGTGSFVSPEGLIMTNYHVVSHYLREAGMEDSDEVTAGFLARSRDAELPCYKLRAEVLESVVDVTARVRNAVSDDFSPIEAQKRRHAVIRRIEEESEAETGLRSCVTWLRDLDKYHLERYRVYRDVRFVFLPSADVGQWFDVCFLRVYEGGKPISCKDFHRCVPRVPKPGELVTAAGHPVHTDRSMPTADLAYAREWLRLMTLCYKWGLMAYELCAMKPGNDGESLHREYVEGLHRYEQLEQEVEFLNPNVGYAGQKKVEEDHVRAIVHKNARLKRLYSRAWDRLEELAQKRQKLVPEYFLVEGGAGFGGKLFSQARAVVRLAESPHIRDEYDGGELDESELNLLRRGIRSDSKIRLDLEEAHLACTLTGFAAELGADHALVRTALAGKHPMDRARELVRGTQIGDREFRVRLLKAGKAGIAKSDDPMIVLARKLEPCARRLRKRFNDEIHAQSHQCYRDIAAAGREVLGPRRYPDADGSLRFSFGTVKHWTREEGKELHFWSLMDACRETIGPPAILERPPSQWAAPPNLKQGIGKTNGAAPLFFESSLDGYYGNSGSAVLNRQGEQIGMLVRGAAASWRFPYEYVNGPEGTITCLAYDGIRELLLHVFDAREILDELDRK